MLDIPVEGEVLSEHILMEIDCVGQDEPCKYNSSPIGDKIKTGDYKESDYMETNKDTHDECNHGIFCVTGKDSDYIDIDDLY